MFVEKLRRDNPKFIESIVALQQQGLILPDSYCWATPAPWLWTLRKPR